MYLPSEDSESADTAISLRLEIKGGFCNMSRLPGICLMDHDIAGSTPGNATGE